MIVIIVIIVGWETAYNNGDYILKVELQRWRDVDCPRYPTARNLSNVKLNWWTCTFIYFFRADYQKLLLENYIGVTRNKLSMISSMNI